MTALLVYVAALGVAVAPKLLRPSPAPAMHEEGSCESAPTAPEPPRPPPPPPPSAGQADPLPLLGDWVWDGCTLARADLRRDAGRWDLHARTGFVPDPMLPELLSELDGEGVFGVHLGFYTRPRSLEPLGQWRDLRYLTFEGDHLDDAGLQPLSDLRELRMLEIGVRPYERNRVTDAGLRALAPLTHLRYLGLHAYSGIRGPGLRWLAGLTELTELELSGTSVGDDSLPLLTPLTSLRTLSLQDTPVTDAGVRALSRLPSLRTLDLRGTQVTPGIAAELAKFPALEHVVLQYNRQWDVIEAVRATGLRADAEGWIRGTVGCERWPRLER